MHSTRRQLFRTILSTAVAAPFSAFAQQDVVIPGKRPMILHNDRPEDLETPLQYFDSWLTPLDAFFVRQHIPGPPPSIPKRTV
jgi:hypothetical protein